MKKWFRSFSFLVLVLVTVLSPGVASAQTHMYVTDRANDAVQVIDMPFPGSLIATVPLGAGTEGGAHLPSREGGRSAWL